jgi:Mrp family chromosome partitioning ATPase
VARGVVARSVAALSKGPFDGAQGRPNRVLGYVENMSGYYCRDCNAVKPLFSDRGASPRRPPLRAHSRGPHDPRSVRAGLEIPCLGTVPFDPELARHCDRGIPLAELPETPVGRALEHVAQQLLDSLESTTPAREHS